LIPVIKNGPILESTGVQNLILIVPCMINTLTNGTVSVFNDFTDPGIFSLTNLVCVDNLFLPNAFTHDTGYRQIF